MGLFDQIFGSSTKQSSSTTGTQDTTQSGTQNTSGTSSQNQASTGSNVTSSLDPATQALLTSLLPSLVTKASAGTTGTPANEDTLQGIGQTLIAKASGTNDTNVANAVKAATDQAKLSFETGEGQDIATTQQAIGSKGNTFSQLIQQKGQNDLTTTIANIAAQGQLQASQLDTQDLNSAISAISSASSSGATDVSSALAPLISIISALKGATTTANSNDISNIIGSTNSDTTSSATSNTDTTGTANGKTESNPGIIGGISNLLSLFG